MLGKARLRERVRRPVETEKATSGLAPSAQVLDLLAFKDQRKFGTHSTDWVEPSRDPAREKLRGFDVDVKLKCNRDSH